MNKTNQKMRPGGLSSAEVVVCLRALQSTARSGSWNELQPKMAQPGRKMHRTYKELPIVIVENHHEVIPFIYKAIGSKYLPLQGSVMIHLDSHPDLLIPNDMKAETVFEKYALFEHLSIENWIMPAAYAGHFNKICWVRPPWCSQIREGSHSFHIGEDRNSKCIRVTW